MQFQNSKFYICIKEKTEMFKVKPIKFIHGIIEKMQLVSLFYATRCSMCIKNSISAVTFTTRSFEHDCLNKNNFDVWLPWFLEFLILNLQVNTVDRTSLNNGLNCASNGFRLYLYIVNICFVISYQWILFIRGKPW